MMTYCFFSAQYLPTVGGVERYTYNLARELLSRGNKVIVVTSALDGYPQKEVQDEILIYRVPAILLFDGRLPFTVSNKQVKKLLKHLQSQKIDRIIVQTRLYTLSAIGVSFAHKNKIPCLVIEHGTSYVGMSNPIVQVGEIIYERLLLSYIRKKCKNFCAVSEEGAKWLKRFNIKTKAVLYNSVREEPVHLADNIREKFKINKNIPIITFIGRLIPEKGIVQLIQAVKKINKNIPAALVVAGDGPLFNKLKKEEDKNIILLGSISHDKVMNLLRQSDIYCLPSDSEGFPTGVVEAVICHCYCVIAPYGGGKELINGRQYGLVMNDNTQEEIEKSLKEALSLTDEQRGLASKQAYQRFLDGFTWEKTCDTLEKITWENLK